ncbi:hypothetical protein ZWY2020_056509 [Hordeum vulgare]|nr:hypothetical protein ZWY2020_056509 [Hordeum vulgare]
MQDGHYRLRGHIHARVTGCPTASAGFLAGCPARRARSGCPAASGSDPVWLQLLRCPSAQPWPRRFGPRRPYGSTPPAAPSAYVTNALAQSCSPRSAASTGAAWTRVAASPRLPVKCLFSVARRPRPSSSPAAGRLPLPRPASDSRELLRALRSRAGPFFRAHAPLSSRSLAPARRTPSARVLGRVPLHLHGCGFARSPPPSPRFQSGPAPPVQRPSRPALLHGREAVCPPLLGRTCAGPACRWLHPAPALELAPALRSCGWLQPRVPTSARPHVRLLRPAIRSSLMSDPSQAGCAPPPAWPPSRAPVPTLAPPPHPVLASLPAAAGPVCQLRLPLRRSLPSLPARPWSSSDPSSATPPAGACRPAASQLCPPAGWPPLAKDSTSPSRRVPQLASRAPASLGPAAAPTLPPCVSCLRCSTASPAPRTWLCCRGLPPPRPPGTSSCPCRLWPLCLRPSSP